MPLHQVRHLRHIGDVAIFLPGRKRSMEQLREALDSFRKGEPARQRKVLSVSRGNAAYEPSWRAIPVIRRVLPRPEQGEKPFIRDRAFETALADFQ